MKNTLKKSIVSIFLLIIISFFSLSFSSISITNKSNSVNDNLTSNTYKAKNSDPEIKTVSIEVKEEIDNSGNKTNNLYLLSSVIVDNFSAKENLFQHVFVNVFRRKTATSELELFYTSKAVPSYVDNDDNSQKVYISSTNKYDILSRPFVKRHFENENLVENSMLKVEVYAGYSSKANWREIDSVEDFDSHAKKEFDARLNKCLIFGTNIGTTCKQNYKVLYIVLGSVGGAALLSVIGYFVYRFFKFKKELN